MCVRGDILLASCVCLSGNDNCPPHPIFLLYYSCLYKPAVGAIRKIDTCRHTQPWILVARLKTCQSRIFINFIINSPMWWFHLASVSALYTQRSKYFLKFNSWGILHDAFGPIILYFRFKFFCCWNKITPFDSFCKSPVSMPHSMI